MKNLAAVRQYMADARRDLCILANATIQPVSHGAIAGTAGVAAVSSMLMNMSVVFAATPLFSRLSSAFQTLLNEAQDLVMTVATFAVVICIIGIFLASMMGQKATSTMVSALKAVLLAFIFFQLMPVILTTIEQVFGSGSSGGGE